MTDLPLTLLTETTSTVTLGWTPPAGCRGYRFEANGKRSSTMDPLRKSVKFAKPGPYRVEALATLAEGVYPPPVTPPAGAVLELGGVYTAAAFAALVQSAAAGPLTVRPKAGQTVTVTGAYSPRSDLTLQTIVFDGQGVTDNCELADVWNWKYLGCTFRGYHYGPDESVHSEALYIGGGSRDGLIDGCTFDDNGTTGHIFFTWFGGSGGSGAWDQGNYPRRICVRNSRFTRSHNKFYSIQARSEIPESCGISVDPSNVHVGAGTLTSRFLRACP